MNLLLLIVLLAGASYIFIRRIKRFYSIPCPAWFAWVLDTRWRRLIQPPETILARSGLEEGMSVLEIGCGSGCFTLEAQRIVGKSGCITALDLQEGMLTRLRKKIRKSPTDGGKEIALIRAGADAIPIADAALDLVFMVTVLPEIEDTPQALGEIWRVLRKNGILAVSELLFDPDYPLMSTTIRWCEEAGFTMEESAGNLISYTVRFRKVEREDHS